MCTYIRLQGNRLGTRKKKGAEKIPKIIGTFIRSSRNPKEGGQDGEFLREKYIIGEDRILEIIGVG